MHNENIFFKTIDKVLEKTIFAYRVCKQMLTERKMKKTTTLIRVRKTAQEKIQKLSTDSGVKQVDLASEALEIGLKRLSKKLNHKFSKA